MNHAELNEKYCPPDVLTSKEEGHDAKDDIHISYDIRCSWERFIDKQVSLSEEDIQTIKTEIKAKIRILL